MRRGDIFSPCDPLPDEAIREQGKDFVAQGGESSRAMRCTESAWRSGPSA
jgi:hypothetical protein